MIDGLKPYPAYKDSSVPWLGDVPGHWEVLPGRSCYREKQVPNVGLQEKTVLSLSYGRIVVKPEDRLHGLVPASFETYQIVEPGNIIIRPTDLQNDQNSLRFGMCRNRGIITSAYMCFETQRHLNPDFGYLLLNTYDLLKVFYGLGSGLRQNLDWKDFKSLPCLVPPGPEQSAIVRFLEYADQRIRRYIRAKQKLIKLLEEQKQAIIQQTVTRGLDPHVRLKPSGVAWLGDIPRQWESLQVRRLVTLVTSGSRGWAQYYSDDGQVFLQSGNLGRSMALDLSFVQHVRPPEGSEGLRTQVRRDDLLICITGALTGNVVLVDVAFPAAYVNQHVALIRPWPDKVLPRFLAYVLHSGTGKIQFKTNEYGGTKQGLGLDDVKNVIVALPDLSEQRAIVADLDLRLASFGGSIGHAEREIALIREYRTRLIADVVTGKFDVREAVAKLPDEVGEVETLEEADTLIESDEDVVDPDVEAMPEEAEA